MNRPNATTARLLIGLLTAITLAAPAVSYGQEGSEDRDRRSRWGRSEDGEREGGREWGRGRDRDRRREDRDEEEKDETPTYVAPPRSLSPQNESMGFGKPKAPPEGRGFGAAKPATTSGSASDDSADLDRRWADNAMKKYDTSRDGRISEAELDKSKIARYDKNNDGLVDLGELIAFSRAAPKSSTGAPLTKKSYRFLTAVEKLPTEGLPSWFHDRDRDGDGQVSMHEWSRFWNSSTVRDFTSKDADGDGIITAAEAVESAR